MTEEESKALWTDELVIAANTEGWDLFFLDNGASHLVLNRQGIRLTYHRVIYGQQPHHATDRKILKATSPKRPSIVRNALEYRLQHDVPKE